MNQFLEKFILPEELKQALRNCRGTAVPRTKRELFEMAFGQDHANFYDVAYQVEGKGLYKEANVVRCKNGAAVNYAEDYMRRRDPNCMYIADDKPTDKPRFADVFGYEFEELRKETMEWFTYQNLLVLPFYAGGQEYGYGSLLICPVNAAFFACALADIQGFVPIEEIDGYEPRAIVYVAPPFRHTHFDGKQAVIHNRGDHCHEVYSYNLYPGPSAKKGVYSVLLDIGEQEGWITAHASSVVVTTPYDNETVIMHEGASGGGKSEMLEEAQRVDDKRILLGRHLISGEEFTLTLSEMCTLSPVTDDMAMCHTKLQNNSGKLVITDAEAGWFLRMDNMKHYGTDHQYELACIHPKEPLVFFNMEAVPGSTCLIWEHTIESNGKPCPNPRAIIPRTMLRNIVTEPVEVDVRSFGVRMPPSTREHPGYGIMGLLQIVPQSLAWLWRLVAPRGYKNPSITDSTGMISEGVGSYWPFATGEKVTQANLLLRQIMDYPDTRHVLIPNQHIGAYEIGFSAEWIAREYLARHGGAKFKAKSIVPARCPLMGYSLKELRLEGQWVRHTFLIPENQSKLGYDGYDAGAKILTDFFKQELPHYLDPRLDPLGREIIECCLNDGTLEDYLRITPM